MKKFYIPIIIILILVITFLVWKCWLKKPTTYPSQVKEEMPKTYFIFEVKAPSITVPDTMLVYKTLPPSVDRNTVEKFRKTFNVKGDIVDMERYYFAKDDQKEIEIFKEPGTGLFKYCDYSKCGLEKDVPNLPSPKEAAVLARNFLAKNEYLSNGKEIFAGSGYFEFVHFDTSGEILEQGKSSISVGFKYNIGDIPLEGAGAKTTIAFGENAEIIEYLKMWRDIEPYRKMDTIDLDTALIEFKGKWGPEASTRQREQAELLTTVIIENIYLAYLTITGSRPQIFVEPVYVIQGFHFTEGEYRGKKITSSEPFKFVIRAIKDIV